MQYAEKNQYGNAGKNPYFSEALQETLLRLIGTWPSALRHLLKNHDCLWHAQSDIELQGKRLDDYRKGAIDIHTQKWVEYIAWYIVKHSSYSGPLSIGTLGFNSASR